MRRFIIVAATVVLVLGAAPVGAQTREAPEIPFVSVPNFLKYPPTMYLGEALAVAENSKGHIILLNHPGTPEPPPPAHSNGNVTTNLLEFDAQGNFVREIDQGVYGGVYGLGYGHAVWFDDDDNLRVIDKGTNAVTKFDPAGYVTLNLGRRPEGFDHYEHIDPREARHVDGYFQGPTDVDWDADRNICSRPPRSRGASTSLTLDGQTLGSLGESGRRLGQSNWIHWLHGISCRDQNELLIADLEQLALA